MALIAAVVAAIIGVYIGVVIWRDASKGTLNSYNASRTQSGAYLIVGSVIVGLTLAAILISRFIFGSM